jgi:tetratricopeptide (TPR) repeat protein
LNEQDLQAEFERAVAFHQQGAFREAQTIYERLLEYSPSLAEAWHYLGLVLYQQGQAALGLEHVHRAIALTPNQASYYSNLATILNSLERFDEALLAAEKSLHLREHAAEAWNNYGNALRGLKNYPQAIAAYQHLRYSLISLIHSITWASFVRTCSDGLIRWLGWNTP